MKVKISFIEDERYTLVTAANLELVIKKESPTWTSESINEFLIAIATKDSNDKIEIDVLSKTEDVIYKHTVDLFNDFSNTYNNEK